MRNQDLIEQFYVKLKRFIFFTLYNMCERDTLSITHKSVLCFIWLRESLSQYFNIWSKFMFGAHLI